MLRLFRHRRKAGATSNQPVISASKTHTSTTVVNLQESTINNVSGHQINFNNYFLPPSEFTSATSVDESALSLSPLPSQPVPPEIFFGRGSVVDHATNLIVVNKNTRIALLGGGGMGKTAAALHILHHRDVSSKYGERRYVVACDATTSADAIAALILKLLRHPLNSGENILTTVHNAIIQAPPTILLLDNFETIWETSSSRSKAQDLLQKLCSADSLSLLLTMRGFSPPSVVSWTYLERLLPLSPTAARDVFLAVNIPPCTVSVDEIETLKALLKEIDHVPLAIHLLAQVGIGFSYSYLIERWQEERTALLQIDKNTPDRLESVEVSISLSIKSPSLIENPEVLQLLGVLCQLPDGLINWKERLTPVASGLTNPHRLLRLLQKTALVSVDEIKVTVLSPIRHFVLDHHPASSEHSHIMENYFWGLVAKFGVTEPGPDFHHSKGMIEPDFNNIETLLTAALAQHPSTEIVQTALILSGFLYWIHPTVHILQQLKASLSLHMTPEQDAECSLTLGGILYMQDQYDEAASALRKGRHQFEAIGDVLSTAQCLRVLGNVLRMQSRYDEAVTALGEARGLFHFAGSTVGAAHCSRSLGNILYMQERYEEAASVVSEARNYFQAIGDTHGAAQCARSLGGILGGQSKFEEAISILNEGKQQFQVDGDNDGAAQCSWNLGNILYAQHRYEEAATALREARKHYQTNGGILGAAHCSESLGDILLIQCRYSEAKTLLTQAREQFQSIGNSDGASRCSQSLEEINSAQC